MFIEEIELQYVMCKMLAILSCLNVLNQSSLLCSNDQV